MITLRLISSRFHKSLSKSICYYLRWECTDPYRDIDKCNQELQLLEDLEKNLANQAALFEVNVPDFLLLVQVRKEIRLVKVSNTLKTNTKTRNFTFKLRTYLPAVQ